MKIARRPTWRKRVWIDVFAYDAGSAVTAGLLGVLGITRFPIGSFEFAAALVLTGASVFLSLNKIRMQSAGKARKEDPSDLEGCLQTLSSVLELSGQGETDPCLRLTVHLVDEAGTGIEQLMNYVGHDRAQQTAGRRFRSTCGVTGQAIKEKELIVAARRHDDYAKYLQEMIDDYGYLEAEAKSLNPATMAWAAMPLEVDGKVVAVVYADATDRHFFTPEQQLLIKYASVGIAGFMKRRYND